MRTLPCPRAILLSQTTSLTKPVESAPLGGLIRRDLCSYFRVYLSNDIRYETTFQGMFSPSLIRPFSKARDTTTPQTLCCVIHYYMLMTVLDLSPQGYVTHHTRYGHRAYPHRYLPPHRGREGQEGPGTMAACAITCISFSSQQPDYFLIGCSDSCIRLHHTRRGLHQGHTSTHTHTLHVNAVHVYGTNPTTSEIYDIEAGGSCRSLQFMKDFDIITYSCF